MTLTEVKRRLRAPFETLGVRALSAWVASLSYAGLLRWSDRFGAVLAALPASGRLLRANLHTAFPEWSDTQVREAARRSAGNALLVFMESLWFDRHPDELVPRLDLSAPEVEQMLADYRSGRGVILLCPHVGNWELSGQALGVLGVHLCVVARPVTNPALQEMLVTMRARRYGMELIPAHGAVRGMVSALRAGHAVGTLIDQNTRVKHGGVYVDFFGLPVPTSRAPAMLARKLGVPVWCGVCLRDNGHFDLRLRALPRPVAEYADDRELTQAMLALNEGLIREDPTQYIWLYKRWAAMPPDAPPELAARYPYYAYRDHAT